MDEFESEHTDSVQQQQEQEQSFGQMTSSDSVGGKFKLHSMIPFATSAI
jgi:hypothetical protein